MGETRDSIIADIESELKKGDPDPSFIDRRIDELYRLDGLSPPKMSPEQLQAAARTVLARAGWRRRNELTKRASKRRFILGAARWAAAACFLFLFLFSSNYVSILLTGSCLPSKAGIKICCGTKICLCDTDEPERTEHLK